MWPTLHHGDSVLVDLTVTAVGRDGIYVIRLGDEVQCKRCSRHPVSGALTIASDNASYPTYQDVRPAGLSVLGRVIWTGRTV
jgi:phage repressor protein C with HTH and peptisase S24 domain